MALASREPLRITISNMKLGTIIKADQEQRIPKGIAKNSGVHTPRNVLR